MSTLSPEELAELASAKQRLENPSIAARLSDYVGSPIESAIERLPESAQGAIEKVTHRSLEKVSDWAVLTMDDRADSEMRLGFHKILAAASGAAGGAAGLAGLAIELPVSTGIIMRSILDIARANGEDIRDVQVRLEALSVFALGGSSEDDDGTESGYFAARVLLARAVTEAAAHLAAQGISQKGGPAIVRLISQIAARFSIPVSSKAAAQAVPIIGAIGGATLNTLFIDHFQDMARGHFTVRRLERAHGEEAVRQAWNQLGAGE